MFEGDISNIEYPKGGLINVTNIEQFQKILIDYMSKHIKPKVGSDYEQKKLDECRELGFNIKCVPKPENIKIGRIGHAIATYISQKYLNLEVPILPWAIPLSLNQELSNYDAICFDNCDNLWILESKASGKKENLSSQISQLINKIENQDIVYIFMKIHYYRKHYEKEIDLIKILNPYQKFKKGNKEAINIIGFFTSSDNTSNIGSNFEKKLDILIRSFRRNVNVPGFLSCIDKIYQGVEDYVNK